MMNTRMIRSPARLHAYDSESEDWQAQLGRRYRTVADLEGVLANLPTVDASVYEHFGMQLTPYLVQLMDYSNARDPLRLQYIPTSEELATTSFEQLDELGEDGDTIPGTSVVHRYPNRVLFLVTNQCGSFCRYCTRKRMVSQPEGAVKKSALEASLDYIRENTAIEDVLLSGGDPLLLADGRLEHILWSIRNFAPHVRFLRIGSRLPVQLPTRITPELCNLLETYDVQMMNLHINHPREITPLLARRVKMLRKAGVMLGNQTVLLRGVNDDVATLRELFLKCVEIGVRPFYVYSTDPVEGAHHFIVSHKRMLELYEGLRGWLSGPAMPTFVVDAVGLGKLPIQPTYVFEQPQPDGSTNIYCRNYRGEGVQMPWLGQPAVK